MNRLITTTALCLSLGAPLAAEDGVSFAEMMEAAQTMDLGETVRMAYIDPFTGPFGPIGDAGYKQFEVAANIINYNGGLAGHRLEVVGFDNKTDPAETLLQLQKAIDDGIRIVTQGNGSAPAAALIDAIDKHNRRNPGDEVIFLNYAAVEPALTNEDCSYWHFRFDANTDMKISAYADWLVDQPDIHKVYIIGQDYTHGRSVSAAVHRELAEKRPDIEIVGDELHPIGRVQDFAPYVQKIISSEADAVFTGNWGTDVTLLVKAMADAGLDIPVLTFYGAGLGAPTAMGPGAVGRVKQISEFHLNIPTTEMRNQMFDYTDEVYGLDFYYGRVDTMMSMLDQAADAAGAVDAASIAAQLEGMVFDGPYGPITMRADDHQAFQPLFIATFSEDVERDLEGTGYGLATDIEIPADQTLRDTTCNMRRPG